MPYAIGAIVALSLLVLVALLRKSRYYRRIFNDEHYAEIAKWAAGVIQRHPVSNPSIEEGTATLTSGELAIAYTSEVREGKRVVHFSVTQRTGYTTGAVGSRVLFLLIRLLHQNKCEANLFRTQSTAHHAMFSMPADSTWVVASPDSVVRDMANCANLPIETVNVAQ